MVIGEESQMVPPMRMPNLTFPPRLPTCEADFPPTGVEVTSVDRVFIFCMMVLVGHCPLHTGAECR